MAMFFGVANDYVKNGCRKLVSVIILDIVGYAFCINS